MEENSVINFHWYCHCFMNEKDRDHPRLPAARLISIMTIRAEASNRRVVTMTILPFQWLNDSILFTDITDTYVKTQIRWYHNIWTMPMLAVEVVIVTTCATVSDQRVATARRPPKQRLFALNCCYKHSNQFHHSRSYINQSSIIWNGGEQCINYAS